MPEEDKANVYVYLSHYGLDRHGEGCPCGLCDARGRSWGVAIFVLSWDFVSHISDTLDWVHSGVAEPHCVLYGPSEATAFEMALKTCGESGWKIWGEGSLEAS